MENRLMSGSVVDIYNHYSRETEKLLPFGFTEKPLPFQDITGTLLTPMRVVAGTPDRPEVWKEYAPIFLENWALMEDYIGFMEKHPEFKDAELTGKDSLFKDLREKSPDIPSYIHAVGEYFSSKR